MNFDEYQKKALETAVYPDRGNNIVYPVLGLIGEAGEVAEKVKKLIRDDDGVLTKERKKLLKKELGDVLWYLAATAHELNIPLSEITKHNLEKLNSRLKRGVIKGDGDTR